MVRQTYRRRGAGYLMPSEYYNPSATQPSGPASAPSSAPIEGWIRPPLAYAAVAGGKRSSRKSNKAKKQSGGFVPAIMGAFTANAQTAIVPLVLLGLYTVFGAKRSSVNVTRKSNNNKKVNTK